MTSILPAPKNSENGTSLSGILPPPKHLENGAALKQRPMNTTERVNAIVLSTTSTIQKIIPPYGQRHDYIPEHPEDFGDGGAFPEIDILQYPHGLGRTKRGTGLGNGVVALTMDGKDGGRLQYEILARQGHTKDRIVFARPEDAVGKSIAEGEVFPRPSEEEIQEITEKTRTAIENIVQIRVASTKPKQVQGQTQNDTFIRYVSREAQDRAEKLADKQTTGSALMVNGGERIIRMVEAKVDPLEPAKFKHKKVAPLGGSPPAPVLHSPPRKATAEEQRAWYVPPSISNWKNPKGYTIPLDKRLASDGRGLQERVINEKFATLAESLYIAENYAREEISARNSLEKKIMEKERREKEEQLRQLAEKARQARYAEGESAPRYNGGSFNEAYRDESIDLKSESVYSKKTATTGATTSIHHRFDSLEEREKIRKERAMEREKEFRLSHMGTERRQAHANLTRERDISEKVALGLDVAVAGRSDATSQFDLRLFHKGSASSGLSSGFNAGRDDSYTLYDKALFQGSNASQLLYHRPSKRDWDDVDDNEETEKSSASRGPIQFESAETSTIAFPAGSMGKEDIFGLDQFLDDAKKGRK